MGWTDVVKGTTKSLVPGQKDYLDFGGGGGGGATRAPLDVLKRRYAGLKVRGLDTTGIEGRLRNRGFNPATITGDNLDALARARFANVAASGPVGARRAAMWKADWTVDRNTKLAEEAAAKGRIAANESINQSYSALPYTLQSITGGGQGADSPALAAIAARWLAGRQDALGRSMLDIDQNLAREKARINDMGANYDVNLLQSIGDTVATLRALDESKRLARNQQWIDAGTAAAQTVPLFL